nr:distal tail protein Dit [Priestia megaterium]
MSFRGITKDYVKVLRGRKRPPWAPIERSILEIPGLAGGYLSNSKVKPRVISVPVLLKKKNFPDLQKLKEDLADWLITDKEEPLIFDDEEDRTYYAVVNDELDLDEMVRYGHGTIEFICPDPYKYGEEQSHEFTDNILNVTNNGTVEADHVIELEVLDNPLTFSTFIMVQNQDNQYMLIGDPLDVESESYQRYERLLYSSADSLVGWTTAGTGEIDGMVSGTMEAVNNRFQAADYGSGSGWHGPAIKQSLPETVQDFRLQTWITLDNSGTTVGRIELYLLDVNGNQIAKISMKDAKSGERLGYGEARAGGPLDNHFLISEYGDRKGNWNNFAGILRIEREGQHWSAFFGIGNAQNGYHARRRAYWTDTRDKYNTPIAQVVVHMGQYGSHAPCVGGIYSASVDKINHQEYGTPVIVQTGDLVRFDTKNEDVWINGISCKDILDFGSDFFNLKPGDNQLIVLPDGNFKTTLKYRDTFR